MPPVSLLIKPASSLCNMRCAYCFYADVAGRRAVPSYGIMSPGTLEALVREAFAYAEGSCGFAFQGGEPTLAGLDFYREFVRLQRKYNVRRVAVHNALQTNGLLIDDAWAAFLAENRFLVGLSLDGGADIHDALRPDGAGNGTHARALAAAEALRRQGCEYNILCVVSRPVARQGRRVYGGLRGHGYIQFIPCIDDFDGPAGDFAIDAAQYGQFLKDAFDAYYADYMRGDYVGVRGFDNYVRGLLGAPAESCAMNGLCSVNPVIEGDGSVYPCDFYVLDAWRLGNVREGGFAEMLRGGTARAFVDASRGVEAACRVCRWGRLCRGGCRRDREQPGGGIGRNRFCAAYADFFEYSIERLREMARREARAGW